MNMMSKANSASGGTPNIMNTPNTSASTSNKFLSEILSYSDQLKQTDGLSMNNASFNITKVN